MATLFWVGGTAAWDGTAGTKWSLTSGGAGGQPIPTAADDVKIDGASGAITVTIVVGNTGCRNLDFTGFTGAFAGATGFTISGNLVLSTTMTLSYSSTLTFNSTTAQTIKSNGKALAGGITFDGVGGSWQLLDNLTGSTTSTTVTLTNGTIDLNGFVLSTRVFSSNNSNTRGLTFGGGSITLTGNSVTPLSAATVTGLTLTGTPVFNLTYSGSTGTRTLTWGSTAGTEATSVIANITAGSDILTISASSKFKALDFTGSSVTHSGSAAYTMYGSLTLSSTMTYSTTGTITFSNTSGTAVLTPAGKTLNHSLTLAGAGGTVQLQASTTITGTMTLTNGTFDLNAKSLTCLVFSSNNSNTRAIISGTGGNIVCTGNNTTVISAATITNLTITGTLLITSNYSGATGTRTITWGSTAGSSLARAIDLSLTGGTDFVLINSGQFGSINLTGFGGTIQSTSGNLLISGSVTLGVATTWASNGSVTYNNTSGTQVLTTNGRTMTTGNTVINGVGTTLQIAGNSTLGNVTLTNGTLDLNGKALTAATFSSNNTNTRNITTGTGGKFVLTAGNGGVLNVPNVNGLTITGSLVIDVTNAAAGGPRVVNWAASNVGNQSAKAPDLNITSGSDNFAIQATSWFRSINYTGFTGNNGSTDNHILSGDLILYSGMTYSSTGVLYFQGGSGVTQQITSVGKTILGDMIIDSPGGTVKLVDNFTQSNTNALVFTSGTLDLNGKVFTTGILSTSNTNVRGITTGSGGKFVLTGNNGLLINGSTLTNLTITGALAVDMTYAGATGNRTFSWSGPTPVFDLNITAGTDIVAPSPGMWVRNLNYTGFNGTLFAGSDTVVGGDLTLSAGMTYSGTSDTYFDAPGPNHQITSAGKTISGSVYLDDVGVHKLLDDLSVSGSITHEAGTLDFNGHNIITGSYTVNDASAVVLFGSSVLTVTGAGAAFSSFISLPTITITYSAGAKISMTSASAKGAYVGNQSWPTISQDGVGALSINDGGAFADIQRTVAGDISLESGKTFTVAALTLGGSGAFKSTTAGVPATVSKASGTVTVSNATITDNIATGGATFNAPTTSGNVDGGGNTGWIFGGAPVVNKGAFFQFMRRP